ncbi:MAG TPA: hypothetical protein VF789_20320 [Thermoanaerobaculia bacterium]
MPERKCGFRFHVPILLSLLAPAMVAAQPQPERPAPLIQLQGFESICTRESDIPFGPRTCAAGIRRERTISIFRNARALSVEVEDVLDTGETEPARSEIRDGFLRSRQIDALEDYLESIVISARTGRCNPFVDTLNDLSSAQYTIFWYGENGRRSTIFLGTEFTRRCPPELLGLCNRLISLGDSIRPK